MIEAAPVAQATAERTQMMPIGDVLPELALLGGAVLTLFYALFAPRHTQRGAAFLAVLTLAVAAALVFRFFNQVPRLTFGDTYALDGPALIAKLIVLAVTTLCVAFSIDWFAEDPRGGEYYVLLLMSALGAVLLAGAADLMEIVLAMLLSSATGYVLVSYHRRSRRAAEAGIKYYLLGALTNGAMVYGIVLLFGLGQTTTLSGLMTYFRAAPATHPVPLVAATALIVVGLAFKMGAVPAHAWMPDVADGAPAPVAAFVTAAPKVGALIALARLAVVLPEATSGWRPVVALIAAMTMTLGNVAALWQDDVRRLLGWSAVSQTGYALMAVPALGRTALAVPSLLFFLVAYVLGNLAAFGMVIELRGLADRSRYAGLGHAQPLLAAALVLSFLSFIGIPPLAGFAAKLALFGAAIDAGYGWLAIVAAVNTVISIAYYVRVLDPMYFGAELERGAVVVPEQSASPPLLGVWAAVAVAVSGIALVLLGVGADVILRNLRSARLLPG